MENIANMEQRRGGANIASKGDARVAGAPCWQLYYWNRQIWLRLAAFYERLWKNCNSRIRHNK